MTSPDICPDCGGPLFMTPGTFDEFRTQCEKCKVRWAFSELDTTPRRVTDMALGFILAGFGLVGLLWFVSCSMFGGQC